MLFLSDLNYTSHNFKKKSSALAAIQLLLVFTSVVFHILPNMVLFVCFGGFLCKEEE